MPPKRRKTSDANVDEQPTKRVTRSSAVTKETSAQSTTTDAPKKKAERKTPSKSASKSKAKETTATTASSSKPNTSKPNAKKSATASAEQPSSNSSPLTITSSLTKTPLQCHTYTPPSSTSTKTLIFTHGAGGTLSAPAVVHFSSGYSTHYPILAFQGSMNLSSRVTGFHACLEHLRASADYDAKAEIVFGGRSMGARAAVIAATEVQKGTKGAGEKTARIQLLLVSYPLKGPKGDLRDQILLELAAEVEVLFVIGERDGMCPLDVLEVVRAKMKAKSRLVVVRGADHGMHVKPAKREGGVGRETGRVAAEWVGGVSEGEEETMYVGEGGE